MRVTPIITRWSRSFVTGGGLLRDVPVPALSAVLRDFALEKKADFVRIASPASARSHILRWPPTMIVVAEALDGTWTSREIAAYARWLHPRMPLFRFRVWYCVSGSVFPRLAGKYEWPLDTRHETLETLMSAVKLSWYQPGGILLSYN